MSFRHIYPLHPVNREGKFVLRSAAHVTVSDLRTHFASIVDLTRWTPERATNTLDGLSGAAPVVEPKHSAHTFDHRAIRAVLDGRSSRALEVYIVDPDLMHALWAMATDRTVRARIEAGWTYAAWESEIDGTQAFEAALGAGTPTAGPAWLIAQVEEELAATVRPSDWKNLRVFRLKVWICGQRDNITVREDGEVLALFQPHWHNETRRTLLSRLVREIKDRCTGRNKRGLPALGVGVPRPGGADKDVDLLWEGEGKSDEGAAGAAQGGHDDL